MLHGRIEWNDGFSVTKYQRIYFLIKDLKNFSLFYKILFIKKII
jgi:hypothetical protein